MKKRTFIIIFIFVFTFIFIPYRVNALEISGFNILANVENTCNGILGEPSDPKSVAWLVQTILDYIKIIGPVLVVVLSGVDFMKCIITSDDDSMVKARKKLTTRLILAALLFFIPVMANALLGVFGFYGTCGIE